jgi:hypothetical protein
MIGKVYLRDKSLEGNALFLSTLYLKLKGGLPVAVRYFHTPTYKISNDDELKFIYLKPTGLPPLNIKWAGRSAGSGLRWQLETANGIGGKNEA